jgi:polyisoprenyl-phosphate glycosyltransferase
MAGRPTVSIIIPAHNEAPCLEKLHGELRAVCDVLPYQFELVFVDDGSTDETRDVLARLRMQDTRIRYLIMSRNFGHQAALSAGLAHAPRADAVIMMDADLQHPPRVIPLLLEGWREGFDIVNTVRLDTAAAPAAKKYLSRAFYWIFRRLTGSALEPGSADFRLMSRQTLDALNALPERQRFLRGLVPWMGFRQTSVPFHAPPRWAGSPKYTFSRSLQLALEGITGFSLYPLRWVAILGFLLMSVAGGYALLRLAGQLIGGQRVSATTWLAICLHLYGGAQLAALGIISEYLGRTLDQVKGRPLYIVRSAFGFGTSVQGPALTARRPHRSPPRRRALRPRLRHARPRGQRAGALTSAFRNFHARRKAPGAMPELALTPWSVP